MIIEGKILMYEKHYCQGMFGIMDIDGIRKRPAWLIDGGIERRWKENYYFDNSRRPGYGGYLIQYTLEGCGIVEKQGICCRVEEGMGFLVRFPEDSRYYLPKDSEKPWTFLYLHFAGDALLPYVERLDEFTGGIFSLESTAKSIRMFLKLKERLCGGEMIKKYESSEFIFSFLCTLLREIEESGEDKEYSLVRKGVEILEQEHRELESIQNIAQRLEISQEHFCRLFKQEMRLTPMQYLTRLRIQSAMYDLLNTDENLENIAKRNGFSNANYFGKVFKKQVGVTPIQYRRQE